MSDVWVELFEQTVCLGGQVRIDGPGRYDSLDWFKYDNKKKVAGNSKSFKIGAAWALACSNEGLGGRMRYFGPWVYCRDLDKVRLSKEIESLQIWGSRDLPELPGDGYGRPLACWVQFPPDTASMGGLRFDAPVDAPRFVRYSAYSMFQGVVTGPGAWVELYPEEDFGGEPLRFEPDTVIRDLSPYYVNAKGKTYYDQFKPPFQSFKLHAVEPAGWPGSSVLPRHLIYQQTELRTAKVNQKLRGAAIGVTKKVPYVGGGLGAIVSTLWPDPLRPEKVWDMVRRTMDDLVVEILSKTKAEDLESKLGVIHELLKQYLAWSGYNEERGSRLNELINHLIMLEPDFADSKVPQATLTYFVQMATIMLALQCERYISFDKLYPQSEDPAKDKKSLLELLQEYIGRYETIAKEGADEAINGWRLKQLENAKGMTGGNSVLDRYTGETSAPLPPDRSTSEAVLAQQRLRVENDYNAQLRDFLDLARLWRYFDPETKATPEPVTAEELSGPFGGLEGYDERVPFADDGGGKPITRIRIWGGGTVDGLEVFYGGVSGGTHGRTDGDSRIDVTLDAGEVIAGIYGRAGEAIDMLVLRTDKGREFGTGGKGGKAWSAGRPHAEARLAKVSGLVREKRSLEALTLHWTYERYE